MRRPPPTGPIRFQIELPRDLHRHLRTVSIQEGVSAAAIVRDLLKTWAAGQDPTNDALRAAYAAGVRAERNRIRAAVDSTAIPDTSTRSGLPVRPPSAEHADTSADLDSRCDRPDPTR